MVNQTLTRMLPESGADAMKRLALLAEASLFLSESLDFEATLQNVARFAVPTLADYCAIDVINENGILNRLAVVHTRPEKAALVHQLWQLSSPQMHQERTLSMETAGNDPYKAMRLGEALLIEQVSDEESRQQVVSEEHWRIYKELDIRSYIAAPMIARGVPIGTISFLTTGDSERRFTEADRLLSQELAARAAMAVDNARRFQEEQRRAEPAALLELLLGTMPTGFALIDSSLRYVRVNSVYAAISGQTIEEHLDRPAAEVVDPEHWFTLGPILRRVLTGETIRDQEIRGSLYHRFEDRPYLLMSFYPVRLGSENTPSIGVVSIDITERKQTENQRRAGEIRYRSLISATTQLIWSTDAEGRMTDWHDWRMYTGQPLEELANHGPTTWLTNSVHPEEKERLLRFSEQFLVSGKPCEIECRLRRFDNEYLDFTLRAVPVRDESTGFIREWIGACTNITERKEAEATRDAMLARETRIARTLQRAMLVKPPLDAFSGIEFDTLYQPAWDDALVGGDFYDAFPVSGGRIAFVVGDVSGKGLEAAAHTAELKYTLRAFLREESEPDRAVARLNSFLRDAEQWPTASSNFVALSVAVLSPETGELVLAVAGMEPPLIIRGDQAETIPADGLPLGVVSDWENERTTARTHLHRDDLLLLCTDGLSEARRPGVDTDFFNQSGVISAALTAAHRPSNHSLQEIGEEVIRAAKAFAGGKLHDDVCVLLARVTR
jgi:PAS domain S-box-containing protein